MGKSCLQGRLAQRKGFAAAAKGVGETGVLQGTRELMAEAPQRTLLFLSCFWGSRISCPAENASGPSFLPGCFITGGFQEESGRPFVWDNTGFLT